MIVTAAPFFEVGEDNPVEDSCVQEKGLWIIDSAIPPLVNFQMTTELSTMPKLCLESRTLLYCRLTGAQD